MQDNAKNALITFSPTIKGYDAVTCLIDSPGVSVSGGLDGGWETITRPRNVGVRNWTGYTPLELTIPILFDNWQDQKSIEDDLATLEALTGRGKGYGSRNEPPTVTLSTPSGFGALVPHNFNGESLTWDLAVEWGDALRRRQQPDGSGGHRVRQAGTVTATQHAGDALLKELSAAKRNNAHAARRKIHVVKKGETLQKISRIEYGTADRWQDIAVANGIRDPRHVTVGKRLHLPK
jgi:LysM repeat protein